MLGSCFVLTREANFTFILASCFLDQDVFLSIVITLESLVLRWTSRCALSQHRYPFVDLNSQQKFDWFSSFIPRNWKINQIFAVTCAIGRYTRYTRITLNTHFRSMCEWYKCHTLIDCKLPLLAFPLVSRLQLEFDNSEVRFGILGKLT